MSTHSQSNLQSLPTSLPQFLLLFILLSVREIPLQLTMSSVHYVESSRCLLCDRKSVQKPMCPANSPTLIPYPEKAQCSLGKVGHLHICTHTHSHQKAPTWTTQRELEEAESSSLLKNTARTCEDPHFLVDSPDGQEAPLQLGLAKGCQESKAGSKIPEH